MHRAYMVLLVVVLLTLPTRAEEGEETSITSITSIKSSSTTQAAPTRDAGLWLMVGGTLATAALGGTAVFLEVDQGRPMPFPERELLRTVGVSSALLAGVAGAVAGTGAVLFLWPSE